MLKEETAVIVMTPEEGWVELSKAVLTSENVGEEVRAEPSEAVLTSE